MRTSWPAYCQLHFESELSPNIFYNKLLNDNNFKLIENHTYLLTWSGFVAAKPAPWPTPGLHHRKYYSKFHSVYCYSGAWCCITTITKKISRSMNTYSVTKINQLCTTHAITNEIAIKVSHTEIWITDIWATALRHVVMNKQHN